MHGEVKLSVHTVQVPASPLRAGNRAKLTLATNEAKLGLERADCQGPRGAMFDDDDEEETRLAGLGSGLLGRAVAALVLAIAPWDL